MRVRCAVRADEFNIGVGCQIRDRGCRHCIDAGPKKSKILLEVPAFGCCFRALRLRRRLLVPYDDVDTPRFHRIELFRHFGAAKHNGGCQKKCKVMHRG